MSTLDFSEREPALGRKRKSESEIFAGNRAFYERLLGQTKKTGIERFGWVALPIAAVAIVGVVAVTSTPHRAPTMWSAARRPQLASASTATPAPATATPPPALNEALASNGQPSTADQSVGPAPGQKTSSSAAKPAASAPAPVKVARRAASSDAVTTAPASAAPVESAPAASIPVNTAGPGSYRGPGRPGARAGDPGRRAPGQRARGPDPGA